MEVANKKKGEIKKMRGCFIQFSELNPVQLHTGRRCEIFSQVNSFDPRVIFEKQRGQPSGYG